MAEDAVTALLATLVEVFGIMLFGFVTFRFQYLDVSDMRGLGFVLSRFLLPALIFNSTSTLNFEGLPWDIIGTHVLVRIILIAIAYLVTLVSANGADRHLKAASAATCMTPNTAGIGIPLTLALYSQKYFGILLGILVSDTLIGPFIMCMWMHADMKRGQHEHIHSLEMDRPARPGAVSQTGSHTLLLDTQPSAEMAPTESFAAEATAGVARTLQEPSTIKHILGLLTNPIMLASFTGLAYRFLFASTLAKTPRGYSLPPGLYEIVNTTKAGFTFLVLFALGEAAAMNSGLLVRIKALRMPLFLCLLKQVLSPILFASLIGVFSQSEGHELKEIRQFVVMIGLFPTSEAGIVYTKMFRASNAVAACTILLSTLFCGPLIFFASVYLQNLDDSGINHTMSIMIKLIGVIALAMTSLFLVTCFVMGRRWLHFGMAVFFVLACFLCAYYIIGILIFVQGAAASCRGTDLGSRVLAGMWTALRQEIDVLIALLALVSGVFRRFSVHVQTRLRTPVMVLGLFLMPCVFIPLQFLEMPAPQKAGQPLCKNRLSLDVSIGTPMQIVLLVITASSLYSGLSMRATANESRDLEQDVEHARVSRAPVYILTSLACCSWTCQIFAYFADILQAPFLAMVGAGAYLAFGPVLFLVFSLGGDGLSRWREVLPRAMACMGDPDPSNV